MKKLMSLVLFVLVLGLFAPITGQAAGGFKDISTNYTFYDEVLYLSSEEIISGFTDGTFRPNDTVTRAQAAIMIGRALDLNGDQRDTTFRDVTSNVTGSGYIASAVEKGIISGFSDRTYKPYQPVTRGQMAIFLNRAFTLSIGQTNSFSDVSSNMAAYQSILNVSADGIASGYSDGTYRPDQSVTRGQFSAFMARTLEPSFRVVYFPDKNLEKAIRNRLNKPTGSIRAADMNKITRIDGDAQGSIKNLSGIEYAKNLTYLDFGPSEIGFNEISDISPLSGLSKLEAIYLPDNEISDISPLSRLTDLRTLVLDSNQISDISPLSGLTNLRFLSVGSNQISDISPLSKLNNLIDLGLSDNNISDIRPLSELNILQTLALANNKISNISALRGLTNLLHLHLDSTEINDISDLSGLTRLTVLALSDNDLSDIHALHGLTNLNTLNLNATGLSDISALSSLTNLTSLELSLNEISDISVLSKLTKLQGLHLSANKISDISPLSKLENLLFLFLTDNELNSEAQKVIENLEARGAIVAY